MLSNGHAGCGGRVRETDRPKDRHRALARPYPSGPALGAGGPTVREAESRGGNRMPKKRTPVRRKATGNRDKMVGPSADRPV